MYSDGLTILSLMHRWSSKREMMGDDPPYLAVGTEVSAKYKGAFCEAKVRKIVRSVKCKVSYKLGSGTSIVTDDQIKGTLRAGSIVEVKHTEKKEYVEATILKIQDCSQYTVVFDDGDITTLRRTALCLKSGRHFAESETLDQLPLTHPEHFGNPVIGGRRGRRNRHDDSSDDEGSSKKVKLQKEEKEADIGKVVCVEISEKKKQKDNWFPGLVVAPTAQDTVKINVKEDYLVRSFKDGRYYTVPKKEAASFTREIGQKVDNNTLRTAVEKALLFLDRDELPPHWDRELLFGLNEITDTDSDGAFDSDSSDDEPREEKDHFVAQLYKFMDDRGTPINKGPTINSRDVDLYKLFKVVHKLGGYNRVTNHNQWKTVSHKLGFGQTPTSVNLVKHAYKKFLHSFEDFYRKLGCTMVNHPRGHRSRHRSSRSLIRDKDKAAPPRDKQSDKDSEEIKEDPIIEVNKEKDIIKEEIKLKDVSEILKPQRELRKESQRPRIDKVEKKDDNKLLPLASKHFGIEASAVNKVVREDKLKYDDREERLKMREIVKLESNLKDDPKNDNTVHPKLIKDVKHEDCERSINLKSNRREAKEGKKDEKEDDKTKATVEKDIRPKKAFSSNPVDSENLTEKTKIKKSRSLFSKITSNKRIKTMPDSKILRMSKSIGLNSVRQKRTFSERMKAMVKKFKIKTGVMHLRRKSTPPPEIGDSEEKKKLTNEECPKSVTSQLTRSRSKDEVSSKVLKLGQEKKSNSPSTTQTIHVDKKQTKKRKENDKSSNDETLDQLPNYKSVAIGDKLKVYYGPTHESKVTYEAKVLSVKQEEHEIVYLVHYTGWNTRYDEWIKRSRIADNLSWTPARAKRAKRPQVQSPGSRMQKKSKNVDVCTSSQMPRSTTPSSVTSSSSRTKSPAASGPPRSMRSRAHSRRTSGHTHTDFSESEMEDDYESDDVETGRVSRNKDNYNENRLSSDEKESKELLLDKMRSRPYKKVESGCESEETSKETNSETILKEKRNKEETDEERLKGGLEKRKPEDLNNISIHVEDCRKDDINRSDRLRNKRKLLEEKSACGYEKQSKQHINAEEMNTQPIENKSKLDFKILCSDNENDSEKNDLKNKLKKKNYDTFIEGECREQQSTERRRSRRVVTHRKEDLRLSSSKDDSHLNDQQPKGRDFDLNQIRSELKGISTSNKSGLEIVTSIDTKVGLVDYFNIEENDSKSIANLFPDDIYEFKEPEPFEFEVRTKCSDERVQRRGFGRVKDECHNNLQVSGNKNTNQTKFVIPKILFENKHGHNKPPCTETEDSELKENHSDTEFKESIVIPQSESKSCNISEIYEEEIKNKESYENSSGLNINKTSNNYQPLNMLCEPGDVNETVLDGDQLVISETESLGTSFSDQHKDHENLLTYSSQLSLVENCHTNSSHSLFSDKLKEELYTKSENCPSSSKENQDLDEDEQGGDDENEIEDDPILNAIKRVQKAFSQSTGDEDSNDIDLLSELPDQTQKEENNSSPITIENNSSGESSRDSNSFPNPDIPSEVAFNLYSPLNDDNLNSDNNLITQCNTADETSESICYETNMEVCQELFRYNLDNSNKHTKPIKLTEDIETTIDKLENSSNNLITEKHVLKAIEEVKYSDEENTKEPNDNTEGKRKEFYKYEEKCVKNSVRNETTIINTIVEEEEQLKEHIEVKESFNFECISVLKPEIQDYEYKSVSIKVEGKEENVIVEEDCTVLKSNDGNEKNLTVNVNFEESESNIESLLCEETIPGSPAPCSALVETETGAVPVSPELPFASTAGLHTVTPPTTPETSLSPILNSPRGERSGSSPVPENESPKTNRVFSEVDLDSFPPTTKVGAYSEDDTNFGLTSNIESMKKVNTYEENEIQSIKKRRRNHKLMEENNKRVKPHRSPRHSNMGSESDDDTSENSLDLLSVHSRSPRPSKYNFTVQLDPELDASQRIAVLQHKLSDLRKTYMSVKSELACIDRRRKKLRRRERDPTVKTNSKPEITCS